MIRQQSGFSLIELVVSLSIMAVLMTLAITSYSGYSQRASVSTGVVSAIISMAHSMGLNVIAEGVETEQQLNVLLDLQCNEIQGFLFSPPVPQEEATALLDQNMESRLHTATARQTTSG